MPPPPYDLVGCWHSHPRDLKGGPQPSEIDRGSWAVSFETFRTGHDHSWVGLILGPRTPPDVDADPWYPPARAAWVVTDGDGETVIDTAKMSWEYEQ